MTITGTTAESSALTFMGATYTYRVVDHPSGVVVLASGGAITPDTSVVVARFESVDGGVKETDPFGLAPERFHRDGTPMFHARMHAELLAEMDDESFAF